MANITLPEAYGHAKAALERGDHESAIAIVQYILRYYPRYVEGYRVLGEAYLERGHQDEAARLFTHTLSADPQNVLAHIGRAIIAEDRGNIDAAIQDMERAFEIDPSIGELRGELLRLYGQRYGSAGATVRTNPAGLAYVHLRTGLLDQAIAEFERVLLDNPSRWDLEVVLCEALWRNEQLDEAAEIATRILVAHPNAIKPNWILGYLHWTAGQSESGGIYLADALALDPDYSFARQIWAATPWPLDPSVTTEQTALLPAWGHGQLVAEELDRALPFPLSGDQEIAQAQADERSLIDDFVAAFAPVPAAPAETTRAGQADAAGEPAEAAPETPAAMAMPEQPRTDAPAALSAAHEEAPASEAQPQLDPGPFAAPAMPAGAGGDWFDSWSNEQEEQARRLYEEDLAHPSYADAAPGVEAPAERPAGDVPVEDDLPAEFGLDTPAGGAADFQRSFGAGVAVPYGAGQTAQLAEEPAGPSEPGAEAERLLYGAPIEQVTDSTAADDEYLPAWLRADPGSFRSAGGEQGIDEVAGPGETETAAPVVDAEAPEMAPVEAATQEQPATPEADQIAAEAETASVEGPELRPGVTPGAEGRPETGMAASAEHEAQAGAADAGAREGTMSPSYQEDDDEGRQFEFDWEREGLPDYLKPFLSEDAAAQARPAEGEREPEFSSRFEAGAGAGTGIRPQDEELLPDWLRSTPDAPEPASAGGFAGFGAAGGTARREGDAQPAAAPEAVQPFQFGDTPGDEDDGPEIDFSSARDVEPFAFGSGQGLDAILPPIRDDEGDAESFDFDAEELPDWLRAPAPGEAAARQAEPEAAADDADLPDWLRGGATDYEPGGATWPGLGAQAHDAAPPAGGQPDWGFGSLDDVEPFRFDPQPAVEDPPSRWGPGAAAARPHVPSQPFGGDQPAPQEDLPEFAGIEPFDFGAFDAGGSRQSGAQAQAPAAQEPPHRPQEIPDLGGVQPFDFAALDMSGAQQPGEFGQPAGVSQAAAQEDLPEFADLEPFDFGAFDTGSAARIAGLAPFPPAIPPEQPIDFRAENPGAMPDLGDVQPFGLESLEGMAATAPFPVPATPGAGFQPVPAGGDLDDDEIDDFVDFLAAMEDQESGYSVAPESVAPQEQPQAFAAADLGAAGQAPAAAAGDDFDLGNVQPFSLEGLDLTPPPMPPAAARQAVPFAQPPSFDEEEFDFEPFNFGEAGGDTDLFASGAAPAGETEQWGAGATTVPAQPGYGTGFEDLDGVEPFSFGDAAGAAPGGQDAPGQGSLMRSSPWLRSAETPAAESTAAESEGGEGSIFAKARRRKEELEQTRRLEELEADDAAQAAAAATEAAPEQLQEYEPQAVDFWPAFADEESEPAAQATGNPGALEPVDFTGMIVPGGEPADGRQAAAAPSVEPFDYGESGVSDEVPGAPTQLVEPPGAMEGEAGSGAEAEFGPLPITAESAVGGDAQPGELLWRVPVEAGDALPDSEGAEADLIPIPAFDPGALDLTPEERSYLLGEEQPWAQGSAGSPWAGQGTGAEEPAAEAVGRPGDTVEVPWQPEWAAGAQGLPSTAAGAETGGPAPEEATGAAGEYDLGSLPMFDLSELDLSHQGRYAEAAEGAAGEVGIEQIQPFSFTEESWAQGTAEDLAYLEPFLGEPDWTARRPGTAPLVDDAGAAAQAETQGFDLPPGLPDWARADFAGAAPIEQMPGLPAWADPGYDAAPGAGATAGPEGFDMSALSLTPEEESYLTTGTGPAQQPSAQETEAVEPFTFAEPAWADGRSWPPGGSEIFSFDQGAYSPAEMAVAGEHVEATDRSPAEMAAARDLPPEEGLREPGDLVANRTWIETPYTITESGQPEQPYTEDQAEAPLWPSAADFGFVLPDQAAADQAPGPETRGEQPGAGWSADEMPFAAFVPTAPPEWPSYEDFGQRSMPPAPDWETRDADLRGHLTAEPTRQEGAVPPPYVPWEAAGRQQTGAAADQEEAAAGSPYASWEPLEPEVAEAHERQDMPVAPDWEMRDADLEGQITIGPAEGEEAHLSLPHVLSTPTAAQPGVAEPEPGPAWADQEQPIAAPAEYEAGAEADPLAGLQQYLQSNPGDSATRLAVAVGYGQRGDYRAAGEQYRALLKDRGLPAHVLQMVVENLQEMVEEQPGDAALHRLLGDAYMKQGQFQAAISQYNWLLSAK